MTEPTRLLDAAHSGEAQRLLRAAASEQPEAAALDRMLDVLRVAPAAASGAHVALGTKSLAAGGAKGMTLWLWIAGGAVALASGTWLVVGTQAGPSAEKRTPPVTAAPTPSAQPVAPSFGSSDRQPTAADAQGVKAVPAVAEQASVGDPESPAASGSSHAALLRTRSIAQEIAAVDGIRAQLASGRSAPALSALRRYARQYPSGAFRQEAEVLRIEALDQAGHTAQAHELAQRFLAEHPASPHAPRVRALVAQPTDAR